MVSFEDVKNKKGKKDEIIVDASSKSDKRVKELESDLKVTKDRLNTTIEKMKTSYEELKAANEELQSMNEESQVVTRSWKHLKRNCSLSMRNWRQ